MASAPNAYKSFLIRVPQPPHAGATNAWPQGELTHYVSVRGIPCAPECGHGLIAAGRLAHFVALTAMTLERPRPALLVASERDHHNAPDDPCRSGGGS